MKLYSTRQNSPLVTFREALFQGQAPDGGLYMPTEFPALKWSDLQARSRISYQELVFYVLESLLGDECDSEGLAHLIEQAYSFAPGFAQTDSQTRILELFHGPTLSFKDFGAQFMAKSMGYFLKNENRNITILVATSGDTGSAVAHAYHHVEGIRIVLLYPSGKVSHLQEKQFTTLGDNITALEIDGTFDDCQALVKRAFADADIREKRMLSSANSINIGRLIPQSIYYMWGVSRMLLEFDSTFVCVPSGNFGKICAGLFAHEMGLPVARFIAAVNANSVISEYIETGEFQPRPSVRTLSNAMDVGNPSNWERIRTLYNDDYEAIKQRLWSTSVNDDATMDTTKQTYAEFGYVADPHTAVGLHATQRFRRQVSDQGDSPCLVLSTAHPAKFLDVVKDALGIDIPLPQALKECLQKPKQAESMANDYEQFKEYLWEMRD